MRQHKTFGALFDEAIPEALDGFVMTGEHSTGMDETWPAGTDKARAILDRFLRTKGRKSQIGMVDPLSAGAERHDKHARGMLYKDGRVQVSLADVVCPI